MAQDYYPRTPFNIDEATARYLQDELDRISEAINIRDVYRLEVVYVAPQRPRDGELRYADGTNWNPGLGEGIYAYYNATWNKLG